MNSNLRVEGDRAYIAEDCGQIVAVLAHKGLTDEMAELWALGFEDGYDRGFASHKAITAIKAEVENVGIIRNGSRFTTLDNSEIRDDRISLSAKGLHHLMQSLPSQSATIAELAAMAPDSESEIKSYLDELELVGYVTRTGDRYQVGGAA